MFTVCPKCALTLVVTAQDLRVAQGYVRCGRCSNVFNAIVGLTDDRGALAQSSQGTATTSIIRKAPSISDDEPAASDPLNDTGESEAVYAEPDANEVKFQEVFAEPPPPTRTTARTPAPTPAPTPETRVPGTISFVAPPPGPAPKASTSRALDSEKRYSDTEGIDTYPESELEFNPNVTDVTKVFVEAAPVAFKGDATGKFRKIVMGAEQPDPLQSPTSNGANASAAARSPTGAGPAQARGNAAGPAAKSSASAANGAASNVRLQGAAAQASAAANAISSYGGATSAGSSNGAASGAKPGGATRSAGAPATPAPAPAARTSSPPPSAPERDEEDLEIDDELRSLAARIDATSGRPAPQFPPSAANDEAVQGDADDEGSGLGDIYAKAVPRPRTPPPAPASRASSARPSPQNTYGGEADDFGSDANGPDTDAEMQAVDSAIDTFTPAAPPRSRFVWWVAGAAVLSLLLVGQAIHHNRHSLATNALLNRPLTRFYKAIGVPLVPSWDLRSYDVRQLGASTNEGGDGTLTVRASLKNNSSQPLPLPLLRITMQDRYGNRIATRDVPPSGYAPGAVPAEAHLGVGQRIDAEMTFKDPGQNAVGFEIDACLATASGRIACANDQTPTLR